ncbi:MAG: hypothetical protein ACK41V_04865 [Acidovorax sp.]|uniref:hypothetical protein n=1 Tax=Acidovorax sp. TaxID=1872122 RepID=UPI00391AA639
MFTSALKSSLLACSLVVAHQAALADALWLERHATGARAHWGEQGQRSPALPTLLAPRAYLADGKDLPITPQAAYIDVSLGDRQASATATPADLRFVASRVSPQGVLTYYQARLGRQETRAVNDLELVPTAAGGNTFKLVWKGQNVAATQVHVETSAGWRRTLAPGADGTVQLETPFPGQYVLEVTARVNGSATVEGKKYDDVRHTATLSFEVPR